MTTDDYRYVDGLPTKYPHWGKELALRIMSKKKLIYITSSFFAAYPSNSTGMLVGLRSIWKIDDKQMTAKIIDMQNWTAEENRWYHDHGTNKVSAGHRAILASFLMARWKKGKLRGRINDSL
jgi:hypothetical protein